MGRVVSFVTRHRILAKDGGYSSTWGPAARWFSMPTAYATSGNISEDPAWSVSANVPTSRPALPISEKPVGMSEEGGDNGEIGEIKGV